MGSNSSSSMNGRPRLISALQTRFKQVIRQFVARNLPPITGEENLLPSRRKFFKVLIAAGGTGGHLFPAQQLAEMLESDAEVLFAGHRLSGNLFFQKKKFAFIEIASHPLKRGFLKAFWKGFWQAIRSIRSFSPDVVVGFGSYHAFPVLMAAAVLRKKMVLFEANCVLGKVNRFFLPFVDRVALQWPIELVGKKKERLVPLLPWKSEPIAPLSKSEARKAYGLDPQVDTLLIFGGSQGASFFNEIAPLAVSKWDRKIQVIHFSGSDPAPTQAAYERFGICACVKAFEPQMVFAYSAATLALCRSGAGTLAELIRFAVPSLLIPYPYATDGHQEKNGLYLKALGGGSLLLQREATEEKIVEELEKIFSQHFAIQSCLQTAWSRYGNRVHLSDIVKQIGSRACKKHITL